MLSYQLRFRASRLCDLPRFSAWLSQEHSTLLRPNFPSFDVSHPPPNPASLFLGKHHLALLPMRARRSIDKGGGRVNRHNASMATDTSTFFVKVKRYLLWREGCPFIEPEADKFTAE